jgi:hypothetical protein
MDAYPGAGIYEEIIAKQFRIGMYLVSGKSRGAIV